MKISIFIKGVLSGVKNYYILRVKEDCEKRIKSPVRMIIIDSMKTLLSLMLIIIIFVITTPAFRSIVDYTIENYTTYNSRINDLTEKIENARTDMINSVLQTMKTFKNPSFDGIRFCSIKGVQTVYPVSCSIQDKRVYYLLSKWAKEEEYDAVIFGESYSGLNGTFYWSDGKVSKYDTDFELIINMLKKKGCKKIMSFVSNTENKNLIPYVFNYINGLFIISEVQNYRFEVLSHKFWASNRSIIIKADNFSGEIIGEELKVSSRPKGLKNETVVYIPQKESIIQNFKDRSREAVEKVKKLMNMVDTITTDTTDN